MKIDKINTKNFDASKKEAPYGVEISPEGVVICYYDEDGKMFVNKDDIDLLQEELKVKDEEREDKKDK